MRIAPINKAEAIIAPLFDSRLADLKAYAVESRDSLPAAISQSWDSCSIDARSGDFVVRWTGRFEFQNYDRLRLFINYPAEFRLTATAELDGKPAELFADVPGEKLPFEPTSCSLGPRWAYHVLTRLEFHFRGPRERETHICLYWIGLVSSSLEPDLERELPRYSPEWPGLLNPGGKAALVEPIFGEREIMERMRKRARQDRFAPLMRSLRQEAARFADYAPEPDIRQYIPCDEHFYRYVRVRDRNRPRWDHPQRIQVLSLAGYLDDNPAWSRLAARHVLALAHTPCWFEGPQANCPGSDWHHICFMESHAMGALCYALPFLGDWLTPAARAMVLDRIEEAWALVNAKCEEPGYRWHMNQGVVGNSLRLMGAALLHHAGRGDQYAAAVEQSYRDHTTVVNNYLAEDGHCSEGGYYTYSFDYSIPMWLVYSAFSGKPVAAVVPERFRRSVDFVEAVTSSLSEDGEMLPLGSGCVAYPWSAMLLAFLHTVCGWPAAGRWLRRRLERGGPENLGADEAIVLLMLVPDAIREQPMRAGIQGCRQSGLVAWQFPTPRHGKLLLEAERPATGHRHDDRGGIILEDLGERLLPDSGTLNYSDLRCAFMHRADWHNLAHPVDLKMRLSDAPDAAIPVPRAHIERAEETPDGFRFAIDVAPVYGPEVRTGRREGYLRLEEGGGALDLRDLWQFAGPHRVEIMFNSYSPWRLVGGNRAETSAGELRIRLEIVEAGGSELAASILDDRVDSRKCRIWTLRWVTPELAAAELRSVFSWERG